ncbi:MAG: hypothetical protein JO102_02360, partial [Elusimicrobia bacterium]|nr:hypothetical protein [Elusimicrobiota bacterium]
ALVRGYRAGPGATAGTLIKFGRHARLHVFATATRFGAGDISNRVEMKAVQSVDLSKRVQARISLARTNAHQEATAGLNLYW